jgi:hypothetical protein
VNTPVFCPQTNALWSTRVAVGLIWQCRFYDFIVFTEKKRVEKLRYVHRNPVERGVVLKPEEWLWSSFRHYACGKRGECIRQVALFLGGVRDTETVPVSSIRL